MIYNLGHFSILGIQATVLITTFTEWYMAWRKLKVSNSFQVILNFNFEYHFLVLLLNSMMIRWRHTLLLYYLTICADIRDLIGVRQTHFIFLQTIWFSLELQRRSWVVTSGTVWIVKYKIFTIWLFVGKCVLSLALW